MNENLYKYYIVYTFTANKFPKLTTVQMIKVDRLMTDYYGITLAMMMENAGRNLALLLKC